MKNLFISIIFLLTIDAFASIGYVANYGSDTVSLFDIDKRTELKQIPVGSQPHGTWLSNNYLYVANMGSNTVSVINTSTNTKSIDIVVGNAPVELLSANGYLYTANSQSNTVSVVDESTLTLVKTLNVGTQPEGIERSKDESHVYVSNSQSQNISVIDTTTNGVIATIAIGTDAHNLRLSEDGTKLYVTAPQAHKVVIVDTTTNTLSGEIILQSSSNPVEILAYNDFIYITTTGDGTLYKVNSSTDEIVSQLEISTDLHGLTTYTEDKLLISNSSSDSMALVDIASMSLVGNISVGSDPRGVSVPAPKLILKAHGGAMQFDGNSTIVTTSTVTTQTNNITLEAWVNWDAQDLGEGQTILYQGNQGSSGYGLKINPVATNDYRYAILMGGVASLYTTEQATTGWHHISATFDGTWKLYVDGVSKTLNSTSGTPNTPTDYLKIGADFNLTAPFTGMLDEIRIWNTARTQSDINSTMNYQLDGNESGLVAYYNFDERVGDTVYDITDNNNTATIEGNVTRLNFLGDGLDFYPNTNLAVVTLPDIGDLPTDATMGAWIHLDANYDNAQDVITLKQGTDSLQVMGSQLWWNMDLSAGGVTECYGTTTLEKERWYYVTSVFDDVNDNVSLYLDGKLDANCSAVGSRLDSVNARLIGNFVDGYNFNGVIAEFSLWDKALTQTEVERAMHSSLKGDETGLVGYWPLNEGTGTTTYDYSSSHNNGTITGAIWIDNAPTIYGNNVYTSAGIGLINSLHVENNTSTPTYSYNGGVPSTIVDFNGTIGVFRYYSDTIGTQTLDVNASDSGTQLNSLFYVTVYDSNTTTDTNTSINLTINLTNVSLLEHNVTNIQIIGVDGNSENLNISDIVNGNISDGNSSYTVPINYPDNNFSIRVDTNTSGTNNSWWYNFDYQMLFIADDGNSGFKTEINSTNNTFNIDLNSTILNMNIQAEMIAEYNNEVYLEQTFPLEAYIINADGSVSKYYHDSNGTKLIYQASDYANMIDGNTTLTLETTFDYNSTTNRFTSNSINYGFYSEINATTLDSIYSSVGFSGISFPSDSIVKFIHFEDSNTSDVRYNQSAMIYMSTFFDANATYIDTDGDGYPDDIDAFPNDVAASIDTDGDGYPDSWNSGKTQSDSTTGLTLDADPNDSNITTVGTVTLNLTNVSLSDFNITNIQITTIDGTTESLHIPEILDGNISDGNNSYTVPSYYPDNNFTIEVNQTFHGSLQSSWYYNFNDTKLYPDINHTTDFKTELNATDNNFTIDLSSANREYYTFNVNFVENDNNVTNLTLMSDTIYHGYIISVNGDTGSYTIPFSELGNYHLEVKVDGNTTWYYNAATGDINSTSSGSTIDTNSIMNLDLNLSSLNFENYTSSNTPVSSSAPTISHVYDRIRRPGFGTMIISFDINDSDSSTLYLDINSSLNNLIEVNSTASGTVLSNIEVNLTIKEVNSSQSGHNGILIHLSDGYSHVYKGIHVEIGSRFDIISNKESNSSAYDSASSNSYTGDLYVLNTYQDYNQSIVEYEKIEVTDSNFSEFIEVKDVGGIVYGIKTETNDLPDTIAFDSAVLSATDLNTSYSNAGMPFSFNDENSSGQKIYIKYTDARLETYDDMNNSYMSLYDINNSYSFTYDINNSYISTYTTLEEFMLNQVKDVTQFGIMRSNDGSRLLVFDTKDDLNNTDTLYGNLIELDENGTQITADAGDWNKTIIDSNQTILSIHPTTSGYYKDMAYVLENSMIEHAEYKSAGDVYSYILLNREAKDEIYSSLSPNPKLSFTLNNGYTYVSLPNSKSLCDSNTTVQTDLTDICDKNNTLESIFGVNTDIKTLFKYTDEWEYWDSADDINASYFMNKFSVISPIEGLLVHATAQTTVNIPFDFEDNQTNTYENMPVEQWIMLSNNKEQSVEEIKTAVEDQNQTLMYIQLYRDPTWHVYAPTNDADIVYSSTLEKLETVKAYESFWIYLK